MNTNDAHAHRDIPAGSVLRALGQTESGLLVPPGLPILAPKDVKPARIEWQPIMLSELGPSTPPDWIWPGYIAKGHSTVLCGLWKAGKSTLLGHILRDVEHGGGLMPAAPGVQTLVVSEESPNHWIRRRDKLGLGDSVRVIARPFKGRPKLREWGEFCDHIADTVRRFDISFVILDTLPSLWCVDDENDAPTVTAALMPLQSIMAAGAGLLLVHHTRKGDGVDGQAVRGSGALPSWVDCIVELRRYAPGSTGDRRRTLKAYSRFDETPPESVLELGEDGYRVIGDKAEATQADRLNTIERILNPGTPPLTSGEVLSRWPNEPKPGKRTIEQDLKAGATSGRWSMMGAGKKNEPHRFVSRTPGVLDAGNAAASVPPSPPPVSTVTPELEGTSANPLDDDLGDWGEV